ncbi:ROK family protein [Dysgonomonas sp. Marseille-P4361]|uniref:ROK family protein n=1 Tax=Dysgonomonas sp. Marseille-P4361 TaxID=2161820 RepID=UPI000D54B0FD|nr:ROK family protein [Dysgonomonas sp. Marseille-P4361]
MNKKLLTEIKKGSKNALIKKKIIKHFILQGSSTITVLSQNIGLSIPTVTRLVSDMCQEQLLEDLGKLETSEGRHPSLYGLKADSAYFVGVDMNQFGINIGLCNFKGEMVKLDMDIPYEFSNTQQAFETLCELILEFIKKTNINKELIFGANINISGRVNPATGYSYSIFYFDEEALSEKFSNHLGLNVFIDNDTRAMTYGEYMAGSVTNEKNIIFVNISWGIAIGIIIDGKIYTGKSGFSGEFGHIKTFNNDVLCHCGKIGCLETEISGKYIYQRLHELIEEGATSYLSTRIKNKEHITIKDIIEAAVEYEDVLCIELFEELGEKLGEQLAGIINIFNPELVIIGGVISSTEMYIMHPIQAAIRKYSLNLVNKDSVITASRLKDKAGVTGACLLARSNIFNNND